MKIKLLALCLAAMISTDSLAFDLKGALKNSGGALIKAGTMTEKSVIKDSRNAVKYMDAQADAVPADPKYNDRLNRLVERVTLPKIKNVKFNFKVYKSAPDNLNAFATPDGSIRFHTALMDKMTDDEVLAVLGHEIGHVVEKHSFKQMRKSLLATAAIRGAASQSSVGTEAYNTGLGSASEKFMSASFSRSDELSADKYALKVLQGADADLDSMKSAIKVLQAAYGDGGGMMSSHPSNPKRLRMLDRAAEKMRN